ncbi:MAG: response regulator [Candidatus Riflebacteria bacterium]|nr:response regulator [Candidatus Riflebacteria bacterium]
MKTKESIRQKAEEIDRKRAMQVPESLESMSPEETTQLLHELRVHQIELEMQNEELRLTQMELSASRSRYFDLYDLAPVGYCTIDESGLILEANLTACTLFGVARTNLVRYPIHNFIQREDRDIYYKFSNELFNKSSESGEPADQQKVCELRMGKSDKKTFWAQLEGSISNAEDGTTICRLIISDITLRKQAEEINKRMQTRISEVQKMEAVGVLAGGVAHDYNNMLSVILGYTELALQETLQNQPVHDFLEEIYKAAKHSAALTQQLLAHARKQENAPIPLILNQVVDNSIRMLRQLIGENINLLWLPEAGQNQVKMDPGQVTQIITNLCVNARDAISNIGEITITTRTAFFDTSSCPDINDFVEGRYVLLTCSDDGCGMEKEVINHIFEPFYTTKGIGEGTGLGLAVVFGIVKQNAGFIEVASEPGHGTTFKIYLPHYAEEVIEAKCLPAEEISLNPQGTVLLVEDEPALLRVFRLTLENLGYRVLSTDKPGKAIELAREHSSEIQFLITDMLMPELNGRDLAKQLKPVCPDMKVLFMSGYSASIMTDGEMQENEINFIQKPFSLRDLAAKLKGMEAAG